MKKTSYLISTIVLIASIVTSLFVFISYSRIIKDSTRNIAELTTMSVYSEIHNELTKPMYVSFTMANDSFLKSWLDNEETNDPNDLVEYLTQIKENYNYNSTFLVSSLTDNYYHYDGILKQVSEDDEHDIWYYSFLGSEQPYELDVDVDEATGVLTIFVNVKVYDEFDNVLAVVGVGLEMQYVQEIMIEYEENYKLDIYLVDSTGLVQSHSNTANIETLNVFTQLDYEIEFEILSNQDELITISKYSGDNYIISKYIDEIDWYIVVIKETNIFYKFLLDYFIISVFVILTTVITISIIINKVINNHQQRVNDIANRDYLTHLLNRRGFEEEFNRIKLQINEGTLLFISDIDDFKKINDKFGHNKGDEILKIVSEIINATINNFGKICRWGGDEFTGIILGSKVDNIAKLDEIMNKIRTHEELKKYSINITIGYTILDSKDNLEINLIKADKALYLGKSSGGNTTKTI